MKWWDEQLILFTPDEYKQLPDGLELTSINNTKAIKGIDYIDMETSCGCIAYGVKDPWNHPLKDKFLIFKLVE